MNDGKETQPTPTTSLFILEDHKGVYFGEADTKADAWALATMIYGVLGVGLRIREEVR